MEDTQDIKCKKINAKRRQIAKKNFTLTGNRGRRIKRRCLNLHRNNNDRLTAFDLGQPG